MPSRLHSQVKYNDFNPSNGALIAASTSLSRCEFSDPYFGEENENVTMERETLSHIDVLIVGAGLGGLFAAIECYRQGHSPRVIESKNELECLGQFSFIDVKV